METKIRIVCATRESQKDFLVKSALGRSLMVHPWPFVDVRLFPENDLGLPVVYNQALSESFEDPAILVFIHDDVDLFDFFWTERIKEGLAAFDIIGLAGTKRRVPLQPGWSFIDDRPTPEDRENLSGVVSHGKQWPPSSIHYFGTPGEEVKLLDGLFLAAHSETLKRHRLTFDGRFDFHFYDVDFCREAEQRKLRMGTWPIQVRHESTGSFMSISWHRNYEKYLTKWHS